VIASGLASLETAANSYIACLPGTNPSGAALRLQIAQTFNGVAVVSGPFIAARYFFTGENADNLTSVQWVYLAASLLGMAVAILFIATDLPETSEAELEAVLQTAAELAGVSSKTDDSFLKVS
jgi:FHS family L-fucose permease-like MFS transporter